MGGGLMQLVAYGAQDIYLTGNPQITFFKVVYRRHTNFSIENIEQTFNGTADFSKKVSCTISRNGDLVHRILLRTTLPKYTIPTNTNYKLIKWVNNIGEQLIKYVEIEIGGQRIDKHYGEWLHLWNELTCPSSQELGYQKMIGNIPSLTKNNSQEASIDEQTLYIPLQFWFCKNPGLALPLIALQYHEVKISIEFQDLRNLLIIEEQSSGASNMPNLSLEDSSLWVDYIFLDQEERQRFAQLSHEYLIEQLQYPGEETLQATSNKVRLNFNHPVKEIIWVVQTQDAINAKQNFNYTNKLQRSNTSIDSTYGDRLLENITENISVDSQTGITGLKIKNSRDKVGVNNCTKAHIKLNGQDRFSEQKGEYFNYVQPYNHHTRTPSIGVNVYSFALKPEEHQPSGTCNFSRIDNGNLFLTVTPETLRIHDIEVTDGIQQESSLKVGESATAKIRIYATNYNVLRIMSGMGGLAYSN